MRVCDRIRGSNSNSLFCVPTIRTRHAVIFTIGTRAEENRALLNGHPRPHQKHMKIEHIENTIQYVTETNSNTSKCC